MANTMTLEQVLFEARLVANNGCVSITRKNCTEWADAIDAAIRERDRLRGTPVPKVEWQELTERAERAEAELAALKSQPSHGHAQDAINKFGAGGELSHEEMCEVVNQAVCAERELAALKARMKPCARVRDGEVHVYMDIADEGKAVAVVVVED